MRRSRKRWRFVLAFVVPITTVLVLSASASAYGPSSWQAAFSGNCNNPDPSVCFATLPNGIQVPATGGFWGWCEFGANTSPTSGTDADCEAAFYQRSPNPLANMPENHQSVRGTAWTEAPPIFGSPPPGFPPTDFWITAGTATFTGPLVVKTPSAPPGCTVQGQTATCQISVLGPLDTGIPTAPGHYSLAAVFKMLGISVPSGVHIDLQVTQIR
jgi:hypothetical protein